MSAFAQMHGAVGVGSSAVLGIGLFSIHRCLSLKAPTAAARQRRANADGSGAGRLLVAESGIHTRADVERLRQCGSRAILVGESLMREPDIGAAVERLLGMV